MAGKLERIEAKPSQTRGKNFRTTAALDLSVGKATGRTSGVETPPLPMVVDPRRHLPRQVSLGVRRIGARERCFDVSPAITTTRSILSALEVS
jgi:hypothetical protein